MAYLHHTPYLGRLIDPELVLPHHDNDKPRSSYTRDDIGLSPSHARSRGAKVSGRILNVTTNFDLVGVRHTQGIRLRLRRGLSSLNAAIEHVRSATDWESVAIAWPGELEGVADEEELEEGTLSSEEKISFDEQLNVQARCKAYPVWLEGSSAQWREYAEHVLWSSFHYVQSLDNEALEQATYGWSKYVELNEKFAETILREYQEGDIIWIHDFYFLLLPAMLRSKLPDAQIGLYIHSPFPSSEILRSLPQRKQLLEGMLGATMVAFQSWTYVRHFVSACTRLTGMEHIDGKLLADGRFVACQALPIGIDVQSVVAATSRPRVESLAREIREMYAGKRIIVGRDKLDTAHGVLQKLRAFELFLDAYPEWRGKVVLIQITTPHFNYQPKLEKQLSQLISYINGEYGSMSFAPVQHYSRHLDQDEYFALLEVADVGFFTPVREGTSHAALEYIACRHEKPCSLILSEFMGVTAVLDGCIPVNPYDALQVAHAINTALTQYGVMMYKRAATYNVQDYVTSFITQLLSHDIKHESQHSTPEADLKKLKQCYDSASKRLFLFDYDGTLTPIVKDPAAAVPSDRLNEILGKLCEDDRNEVWVISGRDSKFLDQYLSRFRVSLSAEHGCFVKFAGDSGWTDLVAKEDMSWMRIVAEVLQSYTERTEGSSIETKKAAVTWHYRRSDPVFGAFQAGHLRAYLELTVGHRYSVDIMNGKANVEIRPKLFNKGEIVRSIFKNQKKNVDFVLCLGDDTTDEDMFRAVNDQPSQDGKFPTLVGPQQKLTLAKYHITNVEKVHDALAMLVGK